MRKRTTEELKKKTDSHQIRLTTQIKGEVKCKFMKDLVSKQKFGINEAELLRRIVRNHYK